jgi:hypothetical protein
MTNSPELQTGITRDIYGMPAFATLEVADLRGTVAWFTGALDFIELFAMPPAEPMLIHLRRWRYQDILVRRAPERRPIGPGLQLSFAAEFEELDTLASRARAFGGGAVEGPADTGWNTRDLTVTTPEGLTIVLTARRPESLQDPAFSAAMRRWADEQR